MAYSTPNRRLPNKHTVHASSTHGIAQDTPLGDLSNAHRDGKMAATGSDKGKMTSSKQKSSTSSRLDSIPSATTEVRITRDWEGPEAKASRPKLASGPSRGGDRFITVSRAGSGPSGPTLLEDAGGDNLSSSSAHGPSSSSSSADETQIKANIAAAQLAPNEIAPHTDSLEAACNIDLNQRILSYSAAPPSSASADVRSRYATVRPRNVPSSLSSGGKRKIPTEAEKVLDAPGMIDDFYYHLIDWSSTNLVAVALQSVVHVWNGDTGEVDTICDLETEPERVGGGGLVSSVRWDADGNYLAIGTDRGFVQLWDVGTSQRVRTLKPATEGGADNCSVNVSAWATDGTYSTGFSSGLIREHDVRQRDSVIRDLEKAHVGHVSGLQWRADSALLASGGNDNVVKVWDRRSAMPKMRKENHQASIKAIDWCPWNSNLLATGGGTADRTIHFWNVTTSSRVGSIQTDAQITGLHWSLHYRELVSTHGLSLSSASAGGAGGGVGGGALGGIINVWSHPSCNRLAEIRNAHDGRILHTALSPDGQVLATVGTDENLKFWRVFERRDEPVSKGSGGTGGMGASGEKRGGVTGGGGGGVAGVRMLR